MTIRPLPGVSGDSLLAVLQAEMTNLQNLRSSPGTAFARLNEYLVWSNDALSRTAQMVRAEDLDLLVTTPRHWTLQALDPAARGPSLGGFVDLEIDERLRTFTSEREVLERELHRWRSRQGMLVIVDTNVFLHHDSFFEEVPWAEITDAGLEGVHLIIPLLVVDELDRHKRSQRGTKVSDSNDEAVRTRARRTLRRIDELLRPGQSTLLQPGRLPDSGEVSAELLLDPPRHVRLPEPDAELVDIAVGVQQVAGRDPTLVTFDLGMKLRCRASRIPVVLLSDNSSGAS